MQIEILRREDRVTRPHLFQDMFHHRRNIFIRRLGWALPEQEDCETDAFDALPDVTYVVALAGHRLIGSLRLLPTTGPTTLETYFPDDFARLAGAPSAHLWECSRFYALPAGPGEELAQPNVSLALLHGLCAHALTQRIARIVGTFEGRMHRIYTRLGWPPAHVEPSINGEGFVGVWDASREPLHRMDRKLAASRPANTNTPVLAAASVGR